MKKKIKKKKKRNKMDIFINYFKRTILIKFW